MRPSLAPLLSTLALCGTSCLLAQQNGIDQSSELLVVPAGEKFLRWYAKPNRSYFLQISDVGNPLRKWHWAPLIEGGTGTDISYEVDGSGDKAFFRLVHTDLPLPPYASLEDWDPDGDRLPNLEEIAIHQSNPLKLDTDDDSLPDDWEIAHGLNVVDDGTEDPLRGPDAVFGSSPSSLLSRSFSTANAATTNRQAHAAGVQAVPGATLEDRDGDLIADSEDADPLSVAINWVKSGKPAYVAVAVPGWNPQTHSFPSRINNRGDILTRRAVWKNGQWVPINAYFQAFGQGPVMPYSFVINGRVHPCHLGQCVVNSISDQGEVVGSGKILIDSVTGTNPATGQQTTYTAGYSPSFGMIWRNPQSLPEIIGVASGTTLQGERHDQSGLIQRDGTVFLQVRAPQDIFVNNNWHIQRRPTTANGGGIENSGLFVYPGFSPTGTLGTLAFGSFANPAPGVRSWIWPQNAEAPEAIYSLTTAATGGEPIDFQTYPASLGTAPNGEACVNLAGQVLVGHSGKYHQVPSLQGAALISPHGAALVPTNPTDPMIWHGGATYILKSCVANADILGTKLSVADMNDSGTLFATVNPSTSTQKLVMLIPVELIDKDKLTDVSDPIIEPKTTEGEQKEMSIAWIDPHGSEDGTNSPDMPHLVLRFRGAEQMGLKIKWNLQVIYNRPRGTNPNEPQIKAQDEVFVPKKVAGQQPWNEETLDGAIEIFNHVDWIGEIQEKGFFGGEARIIYQLLNADGSALGAETPMLFSIGGKNPADDLAKQYIDPISRTADARLERLSYAVAKHESKDYNGGGSRYNQFWDGYARRYRTDHRKGEPLWCLSTGEKSAGGFGIFQITGNLTSQFAIIPREQMWNWQRNANAYVRIIKTGGNASKGSTMDRFFAAVARTYPLDNEAQNPPLGYAYPTDTYEACEMGSITLYNGAGGCPRSELKNAAGKTSGFFNPWKYETSRPSGSRWKFYPNSNNYLNEVINQK